MLLLGNRLASITKSLGMSVLIAERKGLEGTALRENRTSFEETLSKSTALFIACPLTPETTSMIDIPEFKLMRKDAVLINVTRGGIVVEEAIVQALKENQISGVGTDVYENEPANKANSPLIRDAAQLSNLVLSPHLAWYARSSTQKLRVTTAANIEAFAKGQPQNLVIVPVQ